MSSEIWKPVPEFEDYEVSNQGRVRSYKYKEPRILKPSPQRSGHLQLWLRRNGTTVPVRVHRLVLEVFVGPAPEGHCCNHADDNPANNCLTNLKWDTQSANIKQARDRGRATVNPPLKSGLDHHGSKLTREQVLAIRADPRSCAKIAAAYGIATMTAHRCKTKQSYKNVT